jgi:hypothetical protein
MDASTRLYKRLGEIPEDPNDPESLDDLVVCAFGAFERYYVCWKTKGGEYKQGALTHQQHLDFLMIVPQLDGYDLPPALRDWLYPTDGTTRDFASLQVVFGRGEEYFASDKRGKQEHKEPEVKKSTPAEDEEKLDRKALRRSRTVSFLRPLSETSVRSDSSSISMIPESNRSNRSSSISSQRASRPPSLSYTNSRTNSEISILEDTIVEGKTSQPVRPSLISQWTAFGAGVAADSKQPPPTPQKTVVESMETMETESHSVISAPSPTRATGQSAVDGLRTTPTPDAVLPLSQPTNTSDTAPCTCGRPSSPPPLSPQAKSAYANASTQTDQLPSPPRTALRIDTSTPSYRPSQYGYSAVSQDAYYNDPQEEFDTPPVFMGRMMNYFSKPGYQLGDSLFSAD